MAKSEAQKLTFTVPIFEPHPPQYYIRAISDSWLQAEALYTISFHNLALPEVCTGSKIYIVLLCVGLQGTVLYSNEMLHLRVIPHTPNF